MQKQSKKNAEFSALIESLSHDGRGIAKINGKTTFISGALPEENVLFRYVKRKATYDEGVMTQILEASPLRQIAKCQHYGVCGGCNLQHLSPLQQISHKQSVLAEMLLHQANVQPKEWLPPLQADVWGYRGKARLGVKYVPGKDKVLVGFREKNSHFLADLVRCEILHPAVGTHLTEISHLLYQLKIRAHIPQIEIATDDENTALIIRHVAELPEEDLNKLKNFATEYQYKIYLQPKGIDSIHLLYPEQASNLMTYHLQKYHLKFNFHPTQFTQINPKINQLMIERALTLLDLSSTDRVLDLFCGIGNFTLPIAQFCHHVVGVEGEKNAVIQAEMNAELNAIKNAKFYCANLFDSSYNELWSQQKYDKLLLDPPRTGAKEVLAHLRIWQPQRVVYVSCNPATLARDCKILIDQGYQLEKMGVMDMFPHTQHVEAIALFLLQS